jgi:two-component system phosphate regulon sensor histidine kinase PhoR
MIVRPLRYIWVGFFSTIALLALLSLGIGLVAGHIAAFVTLIVGLLLAGGWRQYQLRRLVAWTREPMGAALPEAPGVWGEIFTEFDRRARLTYELRDRQSAALQRFQDASHAMPDGVLILSQEDAIEWLNLKAEKHFGLDRRRDVGAPLGNLVRDPEFVAYLQRQHREEPLLMRSGRGGGLSLQVQIIPFGDNQKLVLSRDISQIETLETMRRDFVANVSHELRTPLTVIGGFLETLITDLDHLSRDEMLRYLQLASEQSGRMQRLIEDLLTLSALETGAPAPVEERVDVGALLQEIAQETALLSAGRHQITLVAEGGGVLRGSQKELHSAIANLASNAVRYTPAGGHIEIGWRRGEHGGECWVEDDGIGIDAAHIPRLTERFYRVDRGRSRETGGTGLGLAIVKHILTRHQAELQIRSEVGKGSRFLVLFPPVRVCAC